MNELTQHQITFWLAILALVTADELLHQVPHSWKAPLTFMSGGTMSMYCPTTSIELQVGTASVLTPPTHSRDSRDLIDSHYSSLVMEKSLCVKTAKKNDRRDKSDSGERSTVDNSGCTWSLMSLKALVCATACGTVLYIMYLYSYLAPTKCLDIAKRQIFTSRIFI